MNKLKTNRKVRADFDKSQPITVDVSGRTKDVKKQVIQAFFDVGLFWDTGDRELSPAGDRVKTYGNVCDGGKTWDEVMWGKVAKGITPDEFFAMVYEEEPQGHPHAELMMQYAEDAKTHAEPWKLWQATHADHPWTDLECNPSWCVLNLYRRKPKTHLVHGVEVPDLRFEPNDGVSYYSPDPTLAHLYQGIVFSTGQNNDHRKNNNLCYEYTEAGKQAAILHAKAMLGIA